MALVPSSVFSFLRSSAAPAPETPGNDGQRRTGSPEPAHSRPPSPAGTHRARASSLASSLRRSLSGSSESVGSFEEVVPLLQEHGGYVNVNPNSPEIQAALEESRTISQQVKDAVYGYCRWLKEQAQHLNMFELLPQDKTLSGKSTFAEVERFIDGIGTEDMSYVKTFVFRLPKYQKESYNLIKSAFANVGGIMTAYSIGRALNLPTNFIFGTQLGEIFARYYDNTISVFERGERPLGMEFMLKWTYLKTALKEKYDKLPLASKNAASELQNWLDFCAQDYVKPTRKEELKPSDIDFANMWVKRYAFILCAASLEAKGCFKPLNNILDENVPFHRRLLGFDSVKRAEMLDLQRSIINACDPMQDGGTLVARMLVGPGGTGKTSIVKMMADYLKVPFDQFSLTKVNVEELRGQKDYSPMTDRNTRLLDGKVGLLAIKLVRQGYGIVFIDEADALNTNEMAEFWKTILQDQKPELKVASLGVTIDLSRFIFIFACNSRIEDPALRQRLPAIAFDGLSKDEKMNAAREALESILPNIEARSGRQVSERVGRAARKWMDFIAEVDIMRNSGGRVIKMTMDSFCGRLEDMFNADIEASPAPAEIEKMVYDIYKKYPAENMLDQRVNETERTPASQYLEKLLNKIQSHAKYRTALEILKKDVDQARVGQNDQAMLIILAGLSGDDETLAVSSAGEQASALFLVGALAKVSARKASEPQNAGIILHTCLQELMAALENNRIDSRNVLRTLEVMREIFNDLPARGTDFRSDRVKDAVRARLERWGNNRLMSADSASEVLAQILKV